MEPFSETPAPENSFWRRQATTIKGIIIFVLVLVLLIPASMVESLIYERQSRREEAVSEVSGKWGARQTLAGPFLALPYEVVSRDDKGKETDRHIEYAYFLPDELKINGDVTPEKRYRGIFEVILYSGKLSLEGSFSQPETANLIPSGATVLWDRARLILGIPDLRGLEDQVKLQWNEENKVFDPGVPVPDLVTSGINAPVRVQAGSPWHFKIDAALKGSGALFFTPVGKITDVSLKSPWSDPSFTGAFLPDQKHISATGFDADWKVLNLNRNYPQQWLQDQQVNYTESAFGVEFLLPVDNYQKSTRSVKYAILFISLTFLTVFFVEMRQRSRVHPFQYALIGLALVIFYTLLVSISEHTSFDAAYLISALMTVGLTGLYARSLFSSNRMALLVGGALSLLYGFLFVVLQQQDYALLIGSFGLFVILAVVMYFSRKIEY